MARFSWELPAKRSMSAQHRSESGTRGFRVVATVNGDYLLQRPCPDLGPSVAHSRTVRAHMFAGSFAVGQRGSPAWLRRQLPAASFAIGLLGQQSLFYTAAAAGLVALHLRTAETQPGAVEIFPIRAWMHLCEVLRKAPDCRP